VIEPGTGEPAGGNLANARRGLAAFSRGDLDDSLSSIHPEIEWHVAFQLPDWPADRNVVHGHDEVRELWVAFRSVWEELTIEIEEVLWDRDDTIVMRAQFRGRGAGSGVEVNRTLFYVMRMRDGMLIFTKTFDDEAEARVAAGAPPA
jgi:ketosteroid isomerase-like protein